MAPKILQVTKQKLSNHPCEMHSGSGFLQVSSVHTFVYLTSQQGESAICQHNRSKRSLKRQTKDDFFATSMHFRQKKSFDERVDYWRKVHTLTDDINISAVTPTDPNSTGGQTESVNSGTKRVLYILIVFSVAAWKSYADIDSKVYNSPYYAAKILSKIRKNRAFLQL